MMTGQVNANLEAKLSLEIRGAESKACIVETVIDTGFNGYLTLDASLIAELELPWQYRHHGELADGSIQVFDVYEAIVVWNRRSRTIEVESVDADPLLGMALMAGQQLRIDVTDNGEASISPFA